MIVCFHGLQRITLIEKVVNIQVFTIVIYENLV